MEKLEVTMEVGPEKVLMSRQKNMALGLAIFNPESYATPKKTYTHLRHEVWGQALSNNVLIENFGPTMCSTPRQELTQGLEGRVGTPPTLPGLLSSEQVSSLGLAIPRVTPPPFQANQAEVETSNNEPRLHTERAIAVNIQNPTIFNNISDNATFAKESWRIRLTWRL